MKDDARTLASSSARRRIHHEHEEWTGGCAQCLGMRYVYSGTLNEDAEDTSRMRPVPHLLFLLVGIVLLAGCTEGRKEPDGSVVTDGLGRTVHLPPTIQRVVTLSPSVTEMLYATGAGSRIVGVSVSDNYPPDVKDLPRFNTYPIDLERIVSLAPDMVVASDQVNHPEQVRPIERLGIPAYFLSSSTLEDVLNQIVELGALLGTSDAAAAAVDSLQQRIAWLQEQTSALSDRPSVLVLAGADPLYGFGAESYVHELVRLAGGTSATAALDHTTPVLSDEFVLLARPDVIIGTDSLDFTAEGILALHPTWDLVPAVAERRVFAIDPDLIYRPGPRLVDGAYTIARLIHPTLLASRK